MKTALLVLMTVFTLNTASAQSLSDAQLAGVAIAVNNAEIKAGNMVPAQSQNADVLAYAAMVVADHTLNNDQINALLANAGMQSESTSVSEAVTTDSDKAIDSMKDLKGKDFDVPFIDAQVAFNQTALAIVKGAIIEQDQDVSDFQAYLMNTRDTLQAHLDRSLAIQASLNEQP